MTTNECDAQLNAIRVILKEMRDCAKRAFRQGQLAEHRRTCACQQTGTLCERAKEIMK